METVRFKALGFDIDVKPGFFAILGLYLLFGLQARQPLWAIASWCGVVFASILIHELGHATMARRLKVRVFEVALHQFGGHVQHAGSNAKNSLAISLAGPGIELLVGVPVLLVYLFVPIESPVLRTVLFQWSWVNVGWAVFNLFPMRPLDGGNALAHLLHWRFMPPTRADRTASIVGLVTGGLVVALGLVFDEIFIMFIGGYCAFFNYQMWQRLSR